MKTLLLTIALIGLSFPCYADRICIEKATGKVIEYQSGDAPLGTLTENAIIAGYSIDQIVERYISRADWDRLNYEQVVRPAQEAKARLDAQSRLKEDFLKQKLGLSDEDWNDLKTLLSSEGKGSGSGSVRHTNSPYSDSPFSSSTF